MKSEFNFSRRVRPRRVSANESPSNDGADASPTSSESRPENVEVFRRPVEKLSTDVPAETASAETPQPPASHFGVRTVAELTHVKPADPEIEDLRTRSLSGAALPTYAIEDRNLVIQVDGPPSDPAAFRALLEQHGVFTAGDLRVSGTGTLSLEPGASVSGKIVLVDGASTSVRNGARVHQAVFSGAQEYEVGDYAVLAGSALRSGARVGEGAFVLNQHALSEDVPDNTLLRSPETIPGLPVGDGVNTVGGQELVDNLARVQNRRLVDLQGTGTEAERAERSENFIFSPELKAELSRILPKDARLVVLEGTLSAGKTTFADWLQTQYEDLRTLPLDDHHGIAAHHHTSGERSLAGLPPEEIFRNWYDAEQYSTLVRKVLEEGEGSVVPRSASTTAAQAPRTYAVEPTSTVMLEGFLIPDEVVRTAQSTLGGGKMLRIWLENPYFSQSVSRWLVKVSQRLGHASDIDQVVFKHADEIIGPMHRNFVPLRAESADIMLTNNERFELRAQRLEENTDPDDAADPRSA